MFDDLQPVEVTPIPWMGIICEFLFWVTNLPVRFALENLGLQVVGNDALTIAKLVTVMDIIGVVAGMVVAVFSETALHKYGLTLINIALSNICVCTLLAAVALTNVGPKWFYVTLAFYVFVNMSSPLFHSFLIDLARVPANNPMVHKYFVGIALMRDTAVVVSSSTLFMFKYFKAEHDQLITGAIFSFLAFLKLALFIFLKKRAISHRQQFSCSSIGGQCKNCLTSNYTFFQIRRKAPESKQTPSGTKKKLPVTKKRKVDSELLKEQTIISNLAFVFCPDFSTHVLYFLITATWKLQVASAFSDVPNIEVAPYILYSLLVWILLPAFEFIFRPLIMKRCRVTDFQWYGLGMFCTGLCLIIAAITQKINETKQDNTPGPSYGQLRIYNNLNTKFEIKFNGRNFEIKPFGYLFALKVYGKGVFYKSAEIRSKSHNLYESVELAFKSSESIAYVVNEFGLRRVNDSNLMAKFRAVEDMAFVHILSGVELKEGERLFLWLHSVPPNNCDLTQLDDPVQSQSYALDPGIYQTEILIEKDNELKSVAISDFTTFDEGNFYSIFVYNDGEKLGIKYFAVIKLHKSSIVGMIIEMILLALSYAFSSVSYFMIIYRECPVNGRATLFSILNFYKYIGQVVTLVGDIAYYIATGESETLFAFLTIHGVCFVLYVYCSYKYVAVRQ